MIAKFHSAPGHSMETTLTISLPPPQSVRAARGEQPRKEKEKEKDKEKEREKKREREEKERQRELEKEREREKEQRDREWAREREREQKEQERERANKVHSERNVSYKDKFQRMREKYDKVTTSHETQQRELETLNAKMKKLQAENDLLLDAMYLADPSLYHRYFPPTPGSVSPTLPSASVPPFLPPNQPQAAYPQTYFPDTHTPSTPYPSSSSHYPSSMPPPGSMAPPLSSTTSGAPGSALSPMPPPLHSMHSPSMAMPPPSSASTNGAGTGGVRGSASSRRPSNASSRSRRTSDLRGGAGSSAGVPLAPEDLTPPNGGRTPVRDVSAPVAGGAMEVEDLPLRSPRVNGSVTAAAAAAGAISVHERASLSGGATPIPITNGASPSLAPRRQPEVPFPVPLRDEDLPAREVLAHDPASIDDDPAYSMTAYAAVNSPDESDEEEGRMMHVDA